MPSHEDNLNKSLTLALAENTRLKLRIEEVNGRAQLPLTVSAAYLRSTILDIRKICELELNDGY